MADVDFDDFDGGYGTGWADEPVARGRTARLLHLAGAACSVLLVIGLAYWGYRLAVRDALGVPVVRAMEGPMRIAPESPGGEIADHQGLAVNTVAALGVAAPPPDRLVLAPRPVELEPEDVAGLSLPPAAGAAPGPATAPVTAPSGLAAAGAAGQPLEPPAAENLGPDPDAVALALAEALAEPLEPGLEPAPAIRPRARPGSEAMPRLAGVEPVALTQPDNVTLAPMAEIDPSAIPVGTRLVQLGAFDTADIARAEWAALANRFPDTFGGKALVVQAAESGGQTFFRLRAHGFADETEARAFCAALLSQNASCIPVEQR